MPATHNQVLPTAAAMSAVPLPEAVLWDMDGTLVDTEEYWLQAEIELVEAHGGSWTYEQGLELIGGPLTKAAAVLRETAGVRGTDEDIANDLIRRMVRQVRSNPPQWRPGVAELLRSLTELEVPMALVTASFTELVEAVMTALPRGTFAAVVTGEEVAKGKPDPEPYLLAADRLGVEITRCVAIEDSLPGVSSAQASGAATIAVPLIVDIPPHPRRRVLPTLTGVRPGDLAAILAELNPAPAKEQWSDEGHHPQ